MTDPITRSIRSLGSTGGPFETADVLRARVDAARAARQSRRNVPIRETIAALAAAARRWQADMALRAALPGAARLSREMVDAIVPLAAAALDAGAMTALIEREHGAGAADRPPPEGPGLVAHVLASNVPALALPAIALGCLAGASVLVKSGRDDTASAPAFLDALAMVDPVLAATVVATYWPGGERIREDALLDGADVVVATGGDAAVAALRERIRARFVAYGPRLSVVAVGADADAAGLVDAIAADVALHDQRGCLSPHAVYAPAGRARALAEDLAAALDRVAERLPPGPASVEERAAAQAFRADAEWDRGSTIFRTRGGTVLYEEGAGLRPTCGLRTVRVHPLDDLATLPVRLPRGAVECVGLAGPADASLIEALRDRGVARVCAPGRMQSPPLSWPRGQQPPLGALFGRASAPVLQVELQVES